MEQHTPNIGRLDMHQKILATTKKFRTSGIRSGAISGLFYGLYSFLIIIVQGFEPLASAVGILAVPFVMGAINDFLGGCALLLNLIRTGKFHELARSLATKPGKIMILGYILGGPVANGSYLVGLYLAGAFAIPISATTAAFGALFAAIFLKQKLNARVVGGMLFCIIGAVIINMVKPEGAPNFTLGIILALVAAICWGLEGCISSFGGSLLDSEVNVTLRQLVSGLIQMVMIVPLIGATDLFVNTLNSPLLIGLLLISGTLVGISYTEWYKANAMVGTAIGMSLNITYAFWGVLLSTLFLNQPITPTIVIGSVMIIVGAILVTTNPVDFFRKGEG
ncbi:MULTISPECIES: DMT family transporter [unclassified Streptococcus]|uniref:DMT family transporter n=1 Tax=unclassified Streptococcus TaxID=2608887 RepID=UPI00107290B8|nr:MULTISPECIES: DMT family transporter [unclassified Streptococcus]MBF0786411.1 DMT family transporter [Streptococcus sp. 19428wC2_LYSM12]MCQ9212518.1 DMT family transporter [Streptococcus sp. B01]MCQ9213857.1 DMT family transporter [Streptococcus sp. O1]TFV06819.1 DMT family transporter [Streptococcus sp. LYSM12]